MIIDIFHDTVCPWCRIGKTSLKHALDQWPSQDVTLRFRTFFLNDSIPPEGYAYQEYMRAKFEGRATLEQLYQGPRRAGANYGLTFNFEKITTTPNTLLSHCLIAITPDDHKETMIDALYNAYFEDGRNIGDQHVLHEIGTEQGLTQEQVVAGLENVQLQRDIKAEAQWAQQIGVTGVPLFIFDQQYALSGAQPPEAFLQVFETLESEAQAR